MPSLRIVCFLLFGFILACSSVRADAPAAMESSSSDPKVHIFFQSYQKTNTSYVFQLYLMDLPANQQPGPKKMGEPLGWNGYIVGNFSVNIFKTSVGDASPTQVDASTLELINPKTGHKVVLTYHGTVPQ